MAIILNIDSATDVCSVVLADNGKPVAHRKSSDEKAHGALLAHFIDQVLVEAGLNATHLDAVAVSKGPGSYTGLRIGVSTAKGICYGANLKLIGVGTLAAMAAGAFLQFSSFLDRNPNTLFCPMIDARRMEVYTALFNREGDMIMPVTAKVLEGDSYKDFLENTQVIFFGSGAPKYKCIESHANALFPEGFIYSAANMAALSEKHFSQNLYEAVAYLEPFYLKDFVATIPKKRLPDS